MVEEEKAVRPHLLAGIVPEETLEHARAAGQEWRKSVASLLPSLPAEFHEHRRAAGREMLLAIRSLIDRAIARSEKVDP